MKALDSVIGNTENKLKGLLKINDGTMKRYNSWEEKSYNKIKILEGTDFEAKLFLLFTDEEDAG